MQRLAARVRPTRPGATECYAARRGFRRATGKADAHERRGAGLPPITDIYRRAARHGRPESAELASDIRNCCAAGALQRARWAAACAGYACAKLAAGRALSNIRDPAWQHPLGASWVITWVLSAGWRRVTQILWGPYSDRYLPLLRRVVGRLRRAPTGARANGRDLLVVAFRRGCPTVARWLIACYAPSEADLRREPILECICDCGDLKTAQWFAARAKLTAADVRASLGAANRNALASACRSGNSRLVRWLIQHFDMTAEDVRRSPTSPLVAACASGRLAVAQSLVHRFKLTAATDGAAGRAALQIAYARGDHPMARWLVKDLKLTGEDVRPIVDALQQARPWLLPAHIRFV